MSRFGTQRQAGGRWLALLAIAAIAITATPRNARADTVVDSATVENGYPSQLTFKVTAHADNEITGVTLSYELAGDTSATVLQPDKFQAAKSVDASVTVPTNTSAGYIPPGSQFTYHWEVVTAGGATYRTAAQQFVYLPPDQQWQTLSNSFMTIYFHSGISDIAAKYLAAGAGAYAAATSLLDTTLAVTPVRVVIFNTQQESAQARPTAGGPKDAATGICGYLPASNVILILPQACATADMTNTLRHELTHIVAANAGGGGLGTLPAWLDEGLALYEQLTPGTAFTAAFASAAHNDALLPFDTMTTEPIDLTQTNLFYGQSYSMVKYLVGQGAGKFAQFFAVMKQGTNFDSAMQQVYGFNVSGFESAFRTANGLPAQAPPPTPPATASGAAAATPVAPAAGASHSSRSGVSRTTVAIFGLALVFLLLAVAAYLLLMVLQREGRHA